MRVLPEIAVWWAITFGVWLATVGTVTVSEVLVAGICSLGCAIPAPSLRRANDGVWKPTLAWARRVPLMLRQLPGVALRVWRCALSGSRSTTHGDWVRLQLPKKPAAVGATRRAVATLMLGATPATVIVESDPEQNQLVLHRLGAGTD